MTDIWAEVKPRFKTGVPAEVGCGPGWQPLVLHLCDALDRAWHGYDEFIAPKLCWSFIQVKAKAGSLLIRAEIEMKQSEKESPSVAKNHENRSKIWNALIRKAVEQSASICEECSKPGVKRFLEKDFKTLCDWCFLKWDADVK